MWWLRWLLRRLRFDQPHNILFQNASINATGYQFFLNGFGYGESTGEYLPRTGLLIVKLVAYNGNCTTQPCLTIFTRPIPSDTANERHPTDSEPGAGDERFVTLNDGRHIIFWTQTRHSYMPAPPQELCYRQARPGGIKMGTQNSGDAQLCEYIDEGKEANDGVLCPGFPTPATESSLS